ncbi:outer membrane protein insertion porin family [Dysgonomonas alginatilytica]|uniref:Outer membrane protein insertion porin family n=1 Tax=Dysgonomonas alginatilytica TaxID=1605892 RepID=A0A2V3PNR9_9BACT|nr:POTRA domain-containing protein [Dysgonomonas alginatilytica]PXV62819.1 outer membrane protein insertion porin family [Dysgonomonas alginatilytica]
MLKRGLFALLLSSFIFKIDAQVQQTDSVALKAVNEAIANSTSSVDNGPLPVITYTLTPKKYKIAEITVSGIKNSMYEDFVLIGFSGLSVGDDIEIPGTEITNAVRRFWKQGLFSEIKITATKIVGEKIWLNIELKGRPRISDISYEGVKKGEREDIESKLGMVKGNQITPNMIDGAKKIIKRYFDDKGFNNAVITITQEEDLSKEDHIILKIAVDKKEKIKVYDVVLDGNVEVSDETLEKAMKKTRHKHTMSAKVRNFLRSTNYVPESYEADKANLIAKYNELGYRDARILWDTVYKYNDKKVQIDIKLDEGQQYFLRSINWVGNTEFSTDQLNAVLNMRAGDVYNQKKLSSRLTGDEDAVGNYYYYNNGYIFYQADPVEINIDKDSVDLEIRIFEGPKATIRKVMISGNDRLYEDIVRRELRTKPGALFSREDLMRSLREVAQMGHFDPEKIQPDVQPDRESGTVDIAYPLVSKANDQVEFSAGWGQTGILGRLSLKFTNFSLKNLLNPGSYKGIIPQGEGQTLQLSGQTNGKYYQSYSVSFTDPWFGGKRPNFLSVGAYYSIQTGVNSNFFNTSNLTNSNYMYNQGASESMLNNSLDPDKSIKTFGVSVGYGKRLNWPDDYFQLEGGLSYQLYSMKNWDYFLVRNGQSHNISASVTLSRNSIDNPIYTRRGTQFSLSVQATPPYSLWNGVDYASMGSDVAGVDAGEKYRWVEYHKWKFKSKTFTSLMPSIQKTPVLMTRAEYGLVGYYNKHKKSPFETFYMGGDGMSGASSGYATEIVGLRGYENGSIGYYASAYTRLALELRYPLILEPSSTIYILSFVEAGNAWSDIKDLNPFDLKRSAGFGARIMLPMIGLIGIDWAYGFDKVNNQRQYGGSQFHFIIGQEF